MTMTRDRNGRELLATFDKYDDAVEARRVHAEKLVELGLAEVFGVSVSLVRHSKRSASYGLFLRDYRVARAGQPDK